MIKIYHNPRCSKSREVLEILKSKSCHIEIIEYLKNPPSFDEMKDLFIRLNLKPKDIIRQNETLFKTNFKNKNFSDEEWIMILIENPILIERPIVVRKNKALICRPPEIVLTLL
ncbi:MAG: arsenate reductase (glutaredoxin) [Bacteroidetes bacterium]|nr:arsenate reductase (glutaredoxin) [Bacteroidota bacterium]